MTSDAEEWRTFVGPKGTVGVSSHGRVRDTDGRILEQWANDKGYRLVRVKLGYFAHQELVHRRVLIAFRGPLTKGRPHCAHFDGNPGNNRLENLRWASPKENTRDRIRHGRTTGTRGEDHPRATITAEVAADIRKAHADGMRIRDIATRFGTSDSVVDDILSGRRWKHVGQPSAEKYGHMRDRAPRSQAFRDTPGDLRLRTTRRKARLRTSRG